MRQAALMLGRDQIFNATPWEKWARDERTGRPKIAEMAGVTGLEPATSGVTGRRSNQLSYAPGGDS